MATTNNGGQGTGAARAARLRLTDTGVEVAEATAPAAMVKPVAGSDEAKTDVDGGDETAPLLGAGDAPADVAAQASSERRSRRRRVLLASGVVAILLALVSGVGYFWLFAGASGGEAHQVKPTAPAGSGGNEAATKGLTAEEITQELRRHAPPAGAAPVTLPLSAEAASQPGNSPITDRLPNQDFSATVTPEAAAPQPAPAGNTNSFTPAAKGVASVISGQASATSGPAAEPQPTPAPALAPAQTAHSIRARPAPSPRLTQADENPAAPVNSRAATPPTASPTPTPDSSPVSETATQTSQTTEAAVLPPLGTLLPVRTVATIYTLRHTAYVRLQLTRDMAGPGWALPRGTEFYGQLSGAEAQTGRAFITLLGFIESGTKRWVELPGQLLGADGAEGLPGHARKLNAGWRNAFKKAGSVALDTMTAIALGFGRRPVIVTGDGAGRVLDPLTDEAKGLANGRDGDGFVEVPAATPGYVLVIADPRQVRE